MPASRTDTPASSSAGACASTSSSPSADGSTSPEQFLNGKVSLLSGDCLALLPSLAENSIDACVTDPPYHLTSIVKRFGNAKPEAERYAATSNSAYMSRGFMGKQWDGGDIAFRPEVWAAVWRVLKPGAHLVAFGGTRTYHRMACAIEDAGFEIRDQIGWCYGSGFPKSHDIAKHIDKANGHWRGKAGEVLSENVAMSAANYARTDKGDPITDDAIQWQGWGTALKPSVEPVVLAQKPYTPQQRLAILVPTIGELIWRVASSEKMATPSSASLHASGFLSTATLLSSYLAALWGRESTFTTETAIALTTDLRILKLLLSKIIAACITEEQNQTNGGASDVSFAESISRSALAKCERLACTTAGEIAIDWLASEGSGPEGARIAPAWEPIVLARKPLSESSIAANVLKHGTGAINVDGCRVGILGGTAKGRSDDKSITSSVGSYLNAKAGEPIDAGRWPANLIHDGSEEVLERFPDSDSGEPRPSTGSRQRQSGFHMTDGCGGFGDCGSAARFFYTAKADTDDRLGSKHPTVKPLDLIQYLVRLVCPKGGIVLDPFAGTGTTGEAAWREGFRACLVEREEEYQADIVKRMGLCLAGPDERRGKSSKQQEWESLPLFGGDHAENP